jgi:hypothetical protein
MAMLDHIRETQELVATMRRARLIAPLRPDKYLRIAAAVRRGGMTETSVSRSPRGAARIVRA